MNIPALLIVDTIKYVFQNNPVWPVFLALQDSYRCHSYLDRHEEFPFCDSL